MSTAAIVVGAAGDQLDRVGAIAGLASVIGLGVLALLYFAQAREVKRLREWAGRAPERAAEMEQRVQIDAQRRVDGQPLAPSTTAAQQAAAAALYAKVPPPPPPPAPLVPQVGQLARTGVPVATAIPPAAVVATSAPGSVPVAPVTATPATSPTRAPTPVTTSAPASATAAPGVVTPTPTPLPVPAIPPAATVTKAAAPLATAYPTAASTAAAAAAARSSSTASPSSFGGNGSGDQHTQASAAARPSSPPAPPLVLAQEDDYDDDGFSPGRVIAIVGGAAAVVLVAILLMVSLTGDEPKPPPNEIGGATAPVAGPAEDPDTPAEDPQAPAGNAVDRPATNVAVLNGTTQTGLARGVADKLEQAKFTISTVGNNADQRVPSTIVSYTEGNERAAQIVANAIGVERGDVQPSDRNATVAAEADVVVTVGTDQIE